MWVNNWRDKALENLATEWDMIIIGGGITGAGVFRMAAYSGIKVLLLERHDFASGTSSRSSKLVHGGLRYLKNYQFHVTYESVNQREKLLREAKYLVNPLLFFLPVYSSYKTSSRKINFSLFLYDAFGRKKAHGEIPLKEISSQAPFLRKEDLIGSFYYYDASVDDARLVFRNIQEGISAGGMALNYVNVKELITDDENKVIGIIAHQNNEGKQQDFNIYANIVVNATGPWSDDIRKKISSKKIIRKLRGSHLQFSQNRFPVCNAFSIFHPKDGRSLFVIPWEGITLVGTTDLDHTTSFEKKHPEPYISKEEEKYLLEAVNFYFPEINLSQEDIISSFSGIRPIVSSRDNDPSKASRKEMILEENGLFTITGGKLTTYGKMSYKLLKAIYPNMLDKQIRINKNDALFDAPPQGTLNSNLPRERINRIKGRFGKLAKEFLFNCNSKELNLIEGTKFCMAELRWSARFEAVCHLDDLLLRRSRLGLLLPNAGLAYEQEIKKIVQIELGWDDKKWKNEITRYYKIWKDCYFLQ